MAIKKSAKVSAKKPVKKLPSATSRIVATAMKAPKSQPLKIMGKTKLYIIGTLIILAILLFVFKGIFVAALVNGSPISRLSVVQLLEKQAGQKALDSLVTKTLILQEAQKQHINITQQDINSEITKIEDNLKSQGQNLNDALKSQGLTRADLEDQIKLQKIVTKLAGNITVSDKEIDDYIAKNKDSLNQATDQAKLRDDVKAQLIAQKTQSKIQSIVQNLQQKAKIIYFVKF